MRNTENIQGKNPFKVPDNYFEEVNRKILLKTAGIEKNSERTGITRSLRPYLLAAASVAGFLLLSYSVAKYVIAGRAKNNADSLYAFTLQDQYLNDIDLYTLEEQTVSTGWMDGISGIEKSDIVDYLMHENLETNEIYEEL
jgi:hypothetical protein